MKLQIATQQQIEVLICELDPDSSGHITFVSFCQGVETYLLGE